LWILGLASFLEAFFLEAQKVGGKKLNRSPWGRPRKPLSTYQILRDKNSSNLFSVSSRFEQSVNEDYL